MKPSTMFLLAAAFCTPLLNAQPEGLWQGYDGEWMHVSQQLIALAEATPNLPGDRHRACAP
jgi:hypothetical protein